MTTLTDKQKKRLREHSKHHTAAHMTRMRKEMRKGVSFSKAHMMAKKM